ncbi:hypothetical protein JXA47_04970, partial [Candidatus Sumerlaeota bacterium]|nr:hypothetical protein [Candidatus Sumerlaeota bacterium]
RLWRTCRSLCPGLCSFAPPALDEVVKPLVLFFSGEDGHVEGQKREGAKQIPHLILAGHPTMTTRVREALPSHLLEKLIDAVPASGESSASDIVKTTLAAFVEAEERESRTAADDLARQFHTGGLAVVGTSPSFQVLGRNQADMLIMTRDYAPGQGWVCSSCGTLHIRPTDLVECPSCDSISLRDIDIKEELVRMAEQDSCHVEVVNRSEALKRLGGVGCLPRYRLSDDYSQHGTPEGDES